MIVHVEKTYSFGIHHSLLQILKGSSLPDAEGEVFSCVACLHC